MTTRRKAMSLITVHTVCFIAPQTHIAVAVFDPDTLELLESFGGGALFAVRDVSFGPNDEVALAVTGLSAVALYDDLAALASPLKRTNPPSGMAAICHLVPRRSTRDVSTGPKPMEKTSAWMPDQRPTM